MRKVVHKKFWAWEFEKEEEWLNSMAAKGLVLISTGLFKYEFDQCLPGEYTIRLELLENHPMHAESQQYISFLEETGAEHIGGLLRWVYFRKKTSEGTFDLYSDINSRIKHYSIIIYLLTFVSIFNIFIGCFNLTIFYLHLNNYTNPNIIGIANLALGLFCGVGCLRVRKKRSRLKKEQQIYE